jgi:Flp pilus assembly protein TadG
MSPIDVRRILSSLTRGFARALSRVAAATEGTAAVEFAVIAPVMITMFFGVTEISDAYTAKTKLTAVASTAGDLVAQEKNICDSDMDDVFAAVSQVMSPYPINTLNVVVSSLIDNGNNQVKVAWSDAHNGSPRSVNTIVTIPSGLVTSGSGESVIMAEVTYTYTPPSGHVLSTAMQFTDTFYLHPRKVAQVTRTSSCT